MGCRVLDGALFDKFSVLVQVTLIVAKRFRIDVIMCHSQSDRKRPAFLNARDAMRRAVVSSCRHKPGHRPSAIHHVHPNTSQPGAALPGYVVDPGLSDGRQRSGRSHVSIAITGQEEAGQKEEASRRRTFVIWLGWLGTEGGKPY